MFSSSSSRSTASSSAGTIACNLGKLLMSQGRGHEIHPIISDFREVDNANANANASRDGDSSNSSPFKHGAVVKELLRLVDSVPVPK